MDSGYLIILNALRRLESCLCAVLDGQSAGSERRVVGFTLRAAGSDLVGNTIDDLGRPVFNDLGGGPVFDDFNNGPIFDGEPFVDPVFDAAPDSDHAAVTMLKFANSARAIHDQANPDDLAAGPVFDTETNYNHVVVAVIECTESEFDAAFACSDKGPGDLSPAHTGAILGGDLLFNKEPEIEDAASFTNMYLVIGTDFAPPATTVDTLCTCSTKFPYNSFNTYCFSMDTCADSVQRDHGGLFIADSKQLIHVRGVVTPSLVEYRSVLSDSIAANGIETKFWDPGAAGCLGFMALSGSGAAFLWDPGSLESLQSIGFANFHLAHPHELHVDKFESKLWDPGLAEGSRFIELTGIGSDFQILLLQQKCGGTADMWVIALGYMCRECQFKTWKFSFLEEIAQVGSFSVSGNVEFLHSGLDHHVPHVIACAQLQSSMCYWCKDVGCRWESQWITCWKIGDIDDSEYIVYQMAPEICSLEVVPGVFLVAFLYSSVVQWIFSFALLCDSMEPTGHWCFIMPEATKLGENFSESLSIALITHKLACYKGIFMVFWCWQLIQMDPSYIICASSHRNNYEDQIMFSSNTIASVHLLSQGHTAEAILAATCYSAWVNNQFCKQLAQSAWDVGDVSVGADEYCTPLVIDSLKNYSASTCSLRGDGGNTKLHTELEELVAKFIVKGAGGSGGSVRVFQYNNPAHLGDVLREKIAGGQPCRHRQVELQGTPEQISKAEQLINEVLAEADAGSSGNACGGWGFNAPHPGVEQFQIKIADNKSDLLPLNIKKRWAEYFKAHDIPHVLWSAKAATATLEGKRLSGYSEEESSSLDLDTKIYGRDEILMRLQAEAESIVAQRRTSITEAGRDVSSSDSVSSMVKHVVVGFVSYTNVGKSSTIYALVGEKKTGVTHTPGKMEHFQTLIISKELMLCDCPGLVFPSFSSSRHEMVACGVLPIDKISTGKLFKWWQIVSQERSLSRFTRSPCPSQSHMNINLGHQLLRSSCEHTVHLVGM